MKRFWVTHGQDGTQIRLEEIPFWAHVMEMTGEWAAEYILPGHLLCCNVPEWAWEIGWGKFDPELEVWEHSLGQLAWHFSSWVELGFGAWRKEKHKGSVSVSYEWVQKHFPELGSPYIDGLDDNDAMEVRASDSGDVVL